MSQEPVHRPFASVLERMKEAFEVDETSPSGLRWKKPNCTRLKPGDPAGFLRPDGYYRVKFDSTAFMSHRIIWAIANDTDPGLLFIDHIDQNKQNNKAKNLRLVSGKTYFIR
jgi:hypothetical protein